MQPIMNTIRGHLKLTFATNIFGRQRQPRVTCLKRPASLWVEDEAVPLGGVVAVVLAKSSD
jgi:hypothetical protein